MALIAQLCALVRRLLAPAPQSWPSRPGVTKASFGDIAALLQEDVQPGDMLMLMIHSEAGGMKTGVFEYTLGATEDGPIKPGGSLVMQTITAD